VSTSRLRQKSLNLAGYSSVIANRMLDVAVAEVGLQRPHIVASVGQCITADVAEHVRVRLEAEFGLSSRPLNHAGKTGNGARRSDVNTNDDLGSCSRWSRRKCDAEVNSI
jgi:hypothetical protein